MLKSRVVLLPNWKNKTIKSYDLLKVKNPNKVNLKKNFLAYVYFIIKLKFFVIFRVKSSHFRFKSGTIRLSLLSNIGIYKKFKNDRTGILHNYQKFILIKEKFGSYRAGKIFVLFFLLLVIYRIFKSFLIFFNYFTN